jgi:hypothetical protein
MIVKDIHTEINIAAVRQWSIVGILSAWPRCPGVWHAACGQEQHERKTSQDFFYSKAFS